MRPATATVLALLAALPAAGAPLATPPVAESTHVHISGFAFSPTDVQVNLGAQVDWDNHDAAPHTATADDASWDSGILDPGATYQRTFGSAGVFPYHCAVHPSMVGRVVVVDPNARPDLVLTQLQVVGLNPLQLRADLRIVNQGTGVAGASAARASYTYNGHTYDIGDALVPGLVPGGVFTASVTWTNTGLVGDFPVHGLADARQQLVESDETNNGRSGATSWVVAGVPGIDLVHTVAP
jgi:plastocyanin